MSELKKDNLFLKKSFSIFFILILVLMPFSQSSGLSSESNSKNVINEEDFFGRIINSLKCAFDKDCNLFEKKIGGRSLLTGFASLGSGGCPSENGKFVLSQDYFKVLILNNREAGIIINSPSSLYGSEGIHESELNPFRDPKELEIFLTSHPMTSFEAPENLLTCLLNKPLREEVDYTSSNDYSYGPAVPAVYATNQDKRFAIGHYYNVVNRIAIGQKAAIETIAFIDYFNGDSVLGDVSPADLFLPSVQEHALKYKSAPFGEPDPNQPGVDARSYLRKDYKEILDSIGLIKRDRHTMRLKMMGLDSLYRGLGSSIWNNNLAEVEYNRLRIEIEKMDLVISSIDQIYSLLEGKEFVEKYHIDYISISAVYYDVVGNTDPLTWPDKIENISVNYLNSQGQHATVLDLQDAMEAQLKDSRESLRNYIDLSEVALETLHNREASYGDIKGALDEALEKSPPVPRFEMNMDDYTSEERLKAYFANQYYTYLPGEIEQMIIARDDAESVAFQIAAVPALVIGGAVAGPWATTSGLVRTLTAVRGASVSGTALLGAAVMGGQAAYTYGSITGAISICTDSFGVWDSYVGSTTRSVKIGDQTYKQRYLGPIESNDYGSCVVAVILAVVDVGLTVYTPPRVKQWLETADGSAEVGTSTRVAHEMNSKLKGKGIPSFVSVASKSSKYPLTHAHSLALDSFWGDFPIPQPRKDANLVWRVRQKIFLDDTTDSIYSFNINDPFSWAANPPKDAFTGEILTLDQVPVRLQFHKDEANKRLDDLFKAAQERELNPYEIAIFEFLDQNYGDDQKIFYTYLDTLSNQYEQGANTISFGSSTHGNSDWEILLHESQHALDDFLINNHNAIHIPRRVAGDTFTSLTSELRANVASRGGDFAAGAADTKNKYALVYAKVVKSFPQVENLNGEELFYFFNDLSLEVEDIFTYLNFGENSLTSSQKIKIQSSYNKMAALFGEKPLMEPLMGKTVSDISLIPAEQREVLAEKTWEAYRKSFLKNLDNKRNSLRVEKIEDLSPVQIQEVISSNPQAAALYGVADATKDRIMNHPNTLFSSVTFFPQEGSSFQIPKRGVHVFNSADEFDVRTVNSLVEFYPDKLKYTTSSGQEITKKAYEVGWLYSESRAQILGLFEDVLTETVKRSEEIGEPIVLVIRSDASHADAYKSISGPGAISPSLELTDEQLGKIGLQRSKTQTLIVAGKNYETSIEYYVTVVHDPKAALDNLRARRAKRN